MLSIAHSQQKTPPTDRPLESGWTYLTVTPSHSSNRKTRTPRRSGRGRSSHSETIHACNFDVLNATSFSKPLRRTRRGGKLFRRCFVEVVLMHFCSLGKPVRTIHAKSARSFFASLLTKCNATKLCLRYVTIASRHTRRRDASARNVDVPFHWIMVKSSFSSPRDSRCQNAVDLAEASQSTTHLRPIAILVLRVRNNPHPHQWLAIRILIRVYGNNRDRYGRN